MLYQINLLFHNYKKLYIVYSVLKFYVFLMILKHCFPKISLLFLLKKKKVVYILNFYLINCHLE